MKNSKEYSKRLRKLYRSLKRKRAKVQPVTYEEPADALVYAIISENMAESAAQAASKRAADYFVDLNDLRVSRPDEVLEILGEDTPATRHIAATLASSLMAIFNHYNAVSLKALRRIGKRPAKQALEKLDGTSTFVVDYCMLTALQGHAIPLTTTMIKYLKDNELVDPKADQQQIGGFLARQVSAKNDYEFYAMLRRESEQVERSRQRRTTRKKKTKKKTKTRKET
jgi:endonuclease III